MRKNKKVYALYHGEDFIDLGTKEELAKSTGISKKTLSFYATKTYRKRRNFDYKRCYILIPIEGEKE